MDIFDLTVMMHHSERHKFVAKAAPLILAAQCIETDITFSSDIAVKNAVELASKLYDEILKLREPDENDD
ncbi:hypothetical protein [Roseofilum sp. Guam]|uniref:hypothetical protein n=1 Tax=Roseofilum sp. Guam TaxID=2821502 RepID=UPI001AFD9A23|nr:hypothetical protein [Roseofilum sp. Guam]MBP0031188.1 hypothetical protein [Roseofilum sp. Guam]